MELGQRLKRLRMQKGMTQEQLAEVIGISRSALSMYELNQREPDLSTLIAIADYFSVSTDYLLGRYWKQHATKEELQELIRMVIKEYQQEYNIDPKPDDNAK
ncbi:MAG: helix-turn-helix transcriptional regulator [Clostridia bacterium]|nr:helix-turn-helix transcriptional regulator [Clostridia bacterium]